MKKDKQKSTIAITAETLAVLWFGSASFVIDEDEGDKWKRLWRVVDQKGRKSASGVGKLTAAHTEWDAITDRKELNPWKP